MIITAVSALVLRLPEVTDKCEGTQDTCLIRIDTDAGITGWGEVDSAPTVVKAVVEAPLSHQIANGLANILAGENPLAIDVCMARMWEGANYYGRSGAGSHAMAGVNQALWDITGKALDQPVCRLLGGPHETKFRAYCSILFGDTPAQTYELARRFADQGFTAIKFGWGPMGQSEANDIELVRQARRGAGDDVDVLIDAGQVWDWKTALKRAGQFEEFRPFWIEEPLNPDDVEGYRLLSEASPDRDRRWRGRIPSRQLRAPAGRRRGRLDPAGSRSMRHLDHGRGRPPGGTPPSPLRQPQLQERDHHRRLPPRPGRRPGRRGFRVLHGRVPSAA